MQTNAGTGKQVMEKDKSTDRLQEVAMLMLTAAISGLAAYLYGKTQIELVRIVLMAVIAYGCVIFAIEESKEQDKMLFDNGMNLWRFTLMYSLFLAGSAVFPLLPSGGWPYLVIFTGLMLFSNQVTGMCAGSALLLITILLSGTYSVETFLIYFVSGMTGVLVFSYVNEKFKVGLPVMVSLMMQMVCLCIGEVLMKNEILSFQMFIIPIVNTMVCLILLLIILKFFSFSTIYKSRDAYMDINDPECPLLVALKACSTEEYYHAIHTAYLCDRVAKRLQIDDAAAKAGGYYHKIGIIKGRSNWENTREILEEYELPEKVCEILREYLDKDAKIVAKETTVLLICDTVISSISYLFSKDPKIQLDYDKLIQAIFRKKWETGILNNSRISIGDIEEMKKILVEEKLYYDFLR